ncbi:phosphoribosyl-AMP cyclohydrolase [Alphaproteobacteria bacterium HT1-32]|nr:phosphoribosyl-AMP cyclohydrolase [Alphaproteobacteria bacterium HT1-32]
MPERNPAENDGVWPVPSDAAISAFIQKISFNGDGLVAAIAQQDVSGEVLMMAWMSAEAVKETLSTGRVCYWSRSRQALWRKGETSGQVQRLIDARVDCDGDTLLLIVDQKGVACHTGRRSCFFQAIRNDAVTAIMDVEISPEDLYHK